MAKRVKNKGGRPPVPKTDGERALASAADQQKVIRLQRTDCNRLRTRVKQIAGRQDLDPAGLAQLARSTAILHERERAAYDIGKEQSREKAVFIMPVAPKTIEDWLSATTGMLPQVQTEQVDPDAGRHIEDPIQGEIPADFEDIHPEDASEGHREDDQ